MALERMRILDIAHSWTKGTYTTYQGKISLIRRFEKAFAVPILPRSTMTHPSTDPSIPLMWCQEAYSLQPGARRSSRETVAFGSVRQIRSAVAQFYSWEAAVNPQSNAYEDRHRRVLHTPCRTTDQLSLQLHSVGMAARIGVMPRPATTLLDRHIHEFDAEYDRRFRQATRWQDKREAVLAAVANLTFWLGWLRSMEAFNLCWTDLTVITPAQGPTADLPADIGAVLLRLTPETKSCRFSNGDVAIAFTTASELSLGKWITRAWDVLDIPPDHPASLIFCHLDGSQWTSHYFRHTHLYPHLRRMRDAGDPYLRSISNLESAFWSMHCYRRGSRSHVSKPNPIIGSRRATLPEVYEHARWRLKGKQSEEIDKLYQEWTLYSRLQLTLLCM